MKILILGHGNIGSILTWDLAKNLLRAQIVVADRNQKRVEDAVAALHSENITGICLDANNQRELVKAMKRFDLVICALPGALGFKSTKAAIDAKINMVDISYMPENALTLNRDALKAGVTIIPDCGVAPGLSNLLVGHALSKLDRAVDIHILVGGLPEKPIPPLDYTPTWSIEDLIHEYTRRAKIVKNGKIVEVETLTGLETLEFSGVGKLEGFFTDGLRTLLHTVDGIENMWEKTLRYPGHAKKIKLLKSLGFFDEYPVKIGNTCLTPRMITVKLLERLKRPEIKDFLMMMVEVNGIAEESRKCYRFFLLDRYDEKHGITAMARTTAYTASIMTQLMVQNLIEEKGVIPLESIGAKSWLFNKFIDELKKRHLKIGETLNPKLKK
jgi:lysine 6-dehydrogenase